MNQNPSRKCGRLIVALTFLLLFGTPCPGQSKTRVVLMCGEPEYQTVKTLPKFFEDHFKDQVVVELIQPKKDDKNSFPEIEKILKADILVLSVHRRVLPKGQLAVLKKYVASKKPLIAIRTATHGFCLRKNPNSSKDTDNKPDGEQWQNFDREVLGCKYNGHEPSKSTTSVNCPKQHLLTKGVDKFVSKSWLYRVDPLSENATILLQGKSTTGTSQPVAWKRTRPSSGTVICSTLGHPSDFKNKGFVLFLKNAVQSLVNKRSVNRTTHR